MGDQRFIQARGERIKQLRIAEYLTQEELYKKKKFEGKITPRAYQRAEEGGRVRLNTIRIIAEAFTISPEDLVISEIPVEKLIQGYQGIPPERLLEEATAAFQRGDFTAAETLNRIVYKELQNSPTEVERVLAISSATYVAITLRELDRMPAALSILKEVDMTRESEDPSLRSQIQRVRGSIIFEMGEVRASARILAEANNMISHMETDELKLMVSLWRNVWIARICPDLFPDSSYKLLMNELNELYVSVQKSNCSTFNKNFSEAIWAKTASGVLISEGKLTKAQDLINPIIDQWEHLPDASSYYQPPMIADFYCALTDIHHLREEYEMAASLRQKSIQLKGFRWSYFPFLLSYR